MSKSRDSSTYAHDARLQLRSRSRASRRGVSAASHPFPPAPEVEAEVLIHPEDSEAILPHGHDAQGSCIQESGEESGEDSDTIGEAESAKVELKPWWRIPSAWWILFVTPILTIARASTQAPRVEIYIQLACDAYKPDTSAGRSLPTMLSLAGGSDRWKFCSSDPDVQAAVAQLATAMSIAMGVLGCLTTAWWGSMSDRRGRTRIIAIAMTGQMIDALGILVVCTFSKFIPGGYWALLVAPTIAGMLGGVNTVGSTLNAYIADCTDLSTRSRYFSLVVGLVFVGYSIGPTLGSLIITWTGSTLSVFYFSTFIHTLYVLAALFVIPESLSATQMDEFRRAHHEENKRLREKRAEGGVGAWAGSAFGFLRPLALLLPVTPVATPEGKKRRNWSLLLLAAGYGSMISLKGDITYEYQYMSLTFGWTSKQLGYYTSALGTTRAIYLMALLPFIMALLQRLSSGRQQPTATIDLAVARGSLVVEAIAYVFMALAPTGYLFTVYAIVSTLGIGFTPAINTVASAVYSQQGGKELGKLFGALGVVQTVSSQVLGPFIFGVTYMRTVATAPKAIFVVTIAALVLSFITLAPIRLEHHPQDTSGGDVEGQMSEGELVRDASVDERAPLIAPEGSERGRKTAKTSYTQA
ncbi:major facilitator superfamily domain-containing protein [Fomitopsis serialis]|uniref:major facilitator superfamily domain-containing protein n=1 Tax=Fomitopsis serialis TaxID=139415 RepID=UPI002008D4AC|nr:major facilitator superfamily domain-containing protein [Neoantrodia serialis]KAH9930707.1 major facilitator superfamily domain-containing protein [Neoantrodia serialis]